MTFDRQTQLLDAALPPVDVSEQTGWNAFWRHALSNRNFVIGITITIIIAAMALISLFWTPYGIDGYDIANRLKSPTSAHWLGTEFYGRDTLSMIMKGSQISIAVALSAVIIGIGIGVPLGCLAAAKGGFIDELLMRGNDVVFAFPAILSAVLIAATFGASATNAVIAIGIFNIPVFARVARGAALSIWPREYVMAARVCGKGNFRITLEHILPNITNLLIVQATIQFSIGIIQEAGLSFVGLGAQAPETSWGLMLATAQTTYGLSPSSAIFPGLAIIITVLGLNLLGDGLRDIFDPRMRRSRQ